MYPVNTDRVVELDDVPQSSVGAPLPRIVAAEHMCLVGFYLEDSDPKWDGSSVRVIDADEWMRMQLRR